MSRQSPEFRAGKNDNESPGKKDDDKRRVSDRAWKWILGVSAAFVLLALVSPNLFGPNRTLQSYREFQGALRSTDAQLRVTSAEINNNTGEVRYTNAKGDQFRANGPIRPSDSQIAAIEASGVDVRYKTSTGGFLATYGTLLFFVGFIFLFFWFIRRQAQGQMNGISAIGKSKAKIYSTERPKTTFEDVAGYKGAKQEIAEVVEFLRDSAKFKEIGAKIPKGVLLVGPPGTGKTLLARAVAGEAGVPFMSITGSDFMEMFVGVGASRVRDLFQTARKEAPAIIFIDEIDSIGRKRGAGLGGGHDEREQTLNQMLAEMDGFEATEGVVIMAATNRPDILDPALLRPGRFDRQVTVPLPDLEERLPILKVHTKGKRISPDVDLDLVARGTPGMSGADLANLVNEAALHAVRRDSLDVHMSDFESARDRIFMGARRESTILSDDEKERVAYHEGGHAVLSYILPHADPLHKVTILPTGMALGVTQQLPMEERHIYRKDSIEASLDVRMGGRVAEAIIYGDLSTGASNDLQGNTNLARRMVTEWGMSDRIGPAAWGGQGQVFLGDDLLHSGKDYSDETSSIIDEEVQRILRESETRAMNELTKHRNGLDLVAKALLERETIDGAEVAKLIDEANGGPVHPPEDTRAHFTAPLTGGIKGFIGDNADSDGNGNGSAVASN